MSIARLQVGSEIAKNDPPASQNFANSVSTLRTVDDVVRELTRCPPPYLSQKHIRNMFTICTHLSIFLGKRMDELSLVEVLEFRSDFRAYLVGRKHRKPTIQTYVSKFETAPRLRKDSWLGPGGVTTSIMARGISPSTGRLRAAFDLTPIQDSAFTGEVTELDTDQWVYSMVASGRSLQHSRAPKMRLWRLLRNAGTASNLPLFFKRESEYSIPLASFPSALQKEVKDMLVWKQASIALGRPKKGKHRPVSALKLEKNLSSLYGFAANVLGREDISSLAHLVDREFLTSYAEWCISVRGSKGTSVFHDVALVFAAVRHYPPFKSFDKTWFGDFLNTIPTDGDEESLAERKNMHYLEYDRVVSIADEHRQQRLQAEKKHHGNPAVMAMEEVLMRFLCTLVWRQMNLRSCRIGGAKPNLFKGPIPRNIQITIPDWVKHELQQNPDAEFWQFRFSAHETKSKRRVHSILPHQLIPPLEEYLQKYRPQLVGDHDPETLFLKRNGSVMTVADVDVTVETLTIRYRGVRVNPHHFRDIFAYAFLEENPENFSGLSKMLWHLSVDFTMRKYGARYNESSAVCAVERWLDRRAAERR